MLFASVASVQASPLSPAPPKNCLPLPLELAGWAAPATAMNDRRPFGLEKAVVVSLVPTAAFTFPKPPERAPDPKSFSNSVTISLKRAGVYRLLANSGVWLDVVSSSGVQPSLSHRHGPACSGIRKMVDYRLSAGSHIIQISGSSTDSAKIMMIRVG